MAADRCLEQDICGGDVPGGDQKVAQQMIKWTLLKEEWTRNPGVEVCECVSGIACLCVCVRVAFFVGASAWRKRRWRKGKGMRGESCSTVRK